MPRATPPAVLHVFGGLHLGGAETWMVGAAPALRSAGWKVEFCLLDRDEGPYAAELRTSGFRVIACPVVPFWSFPLRLIGLLRAGRYAAVHSHVALFSGVVLAAAAAAGVRLRIAHAHNSRDGRGSGPGRRLYRGVMRAALRRLGTHALACSPQAREFFARPTDLLPYGIDLSRFEGSPPRKAPKDRFVIGHVGRLAPQKNQTFLLDAFRCAAGRDPRLELWIVGDGPLRPGIERRIRASGLASRVRLLGPRDDVAELMAGSFDALVMPSLYEGLPLALLEAQAAGLPCLVSERIDAVADAVPQLIERLSLDAGPQGWGAAMGRLRGRAGAAPREACMRLRESGFEADGSAAALVRFYTKASDSLGPRPDSGAEALGKAEAG